jgi:maltooligosyltrehalose trehalohydrolase
MAWQTTLGAWPDGERIRFRVWAPEKRSVEVLLTGPGRQEIPPFALERQTDGTFSGRHPDARAGDQYKYRLDGGEAFPDPASRYQPHGVHGPSQIIDPRSFRWTDGAWRGIPRDQLIIYELHVGTFTPEGTFKSLMQRLPHFIDLGVSAIELMPPADFAGDRNWGYDGVDLFAPARCYGTPDDLRALVNAAHGLGLAVLVDAVYNHLGPEGNYTGAFSPFYVTSRHKTGWGDALNFDGEHAEAVREFFIQNALHWIHEYHFDGLRLDATHAIIDDSPRHFLAELSERVLQSAGARQVHVIAEDNRNLISLVQPRDAGGMGLSAVWSDDFHHQVRRMLAGDSDGYFVDFKDSASDLATTVSQGWLYTGQDSPFFKAPHGTPTDGVPLDRFVVFLQNHDQIGNRALGDRLHHTVDMAAYRAVSVLLMCLPEIPLLFMGQEWAASSPFQYFTDHPPELGKLVTEGRKREFESFSAFSQGDEIPDPQSPETFRRSRLVWDEKLKEPHESIWLLYQALLKFRKEDLRPAGSADDFAAIALEDRSALVIRRASRSGALLLAVIQLKGGGKIDLSQHAFLAEHRDRDWELVMSSEDRAFCPADRQPPVVHVSGPAPVIEFSRPGAVLLRERALVPARGAAKQPAGGASR